jgi:hypothetical protein
MNLSRRVLGAYVVQALSEKASAPLLKIGSDVFHRHDFAQVECFNFMAAANLSRALQGARFKNLKDLFERLPPTSLLLPRVGPVALAVLGAAFEVKGIGGEAPLEAWMKFHQADEKGDHIVTFGSMKIKQRREEQQAAPRTSTRRKSFIRRRTSSALPSAAHLH